MTLPVSALPSTPMFPELYWLTHVKVMLPVFPVSPGNLGASSLSIVQRRKVRLYSFR